MLIRVEYNGDDPQERDFYFVSKDFSRLPSIPVKILQKNSNISIVQWKHLYVF